MLLKKAIGITLPADASDKNTVLIAVQKFGISSLHFLQLTAPFDTRKNLIEAKTPTLQVYDKCHPVKFVLTDLLMFIRVRNSWSQMRK